MQTAGASSGGASFLASSLRFLSLNLTNIVPAHRAVRGTVIRIFWK